ncbi:hypothetical protein IQ274_25440 [Nostoc sp. LEGE 12447]|uniref:hypothetical protein n=1 Tax=Nostoc sp. LEGE 12447 TaxID=1828640 RepID=UPI001884806E|nr:hypothetical protein [Nostoc sp. LEGE 12447]MBE9001467.1 hypothetical protein [Nostoc sp. LEGE 12447]
MQPSNNPQQSPDLVQSSSNNPQVVPSSDGQIESHSNPIETPAVSLKILGSGFSLHLNKWVVLGVLGVAMLATFFLITKGSEFCLFSTCIPPIDSSNSLAINFWGFAGGTAALVILTTFFGVSLMPAVAASFAVWFLMQMTLH